MMMSRSARIAAAAATAALMTGCAGSVHGPAVPAATETMHAAKPAHAATATAEQIAGRMGETGTSGYVAYTAATDPNHLLGRQGEYLTKVNWGDPDETGPWGSVEQFGDQADVTARLALVTAAAPPFGDGYDYTSGTVLLRLGSAYTPAQAKALAARFRAAAS